MRLWQVTVFSLLLLAVPPLHAADGITKKTITIPAQRHSTAIQGKLVGYQVIDYQLVLPHGQSWVADFKPSNRSAYFNVMPPNGKEAIFNGSIEGDHYAGMTQQAGVYTLRVYLMRSAARRNEQTRFTLNVTLSPAKPSQAAFSSTLSLQGVRFELAATDHGSLNRLTIKPHGLKNAQMISREIDGRVVGAEIADLNADGKPELYVYTQSAGSGSYGGLIAYAVNPDRSLSPIQLAALDSNQTDAEGYQGHDAFAIGEARLLRRFPLYHTSNNNARPSAGTRQLQYRLERQDGQWLLQSDQVVQY